MTSREVDTEAILFFDTETLQPACVLIQAALGGDTQFLNQHFDAQYWTTSAETLAPYPVTEKIAKKVIRKLEFDKESGKKLKR